MSARGCMPGTTLPTLLSPSRGVNGHPDTARYAARPNMLIFSRGYPAVMCCSMSALCSSRSSFVLEIEIADPVIFAIHFEMEFVGALGLFAGARRETGRRCLWLSYD